MRVTVVGCGDAFGSGGRFQSSYLIETDDGAVLVDAGATVTTALNRLGRNPNSIGTIVVSHLHGDHFGGLVWLYMQSLYATKRTTPLTVYGPIGIEGRFRAVTELLFPRATTAGLKYELKFVEMRAGQQIQTGPLLALAYEVEHPSGAPSHALRFERNGKVLAYSGDSQWVEALVSCGAGADLYVIECYKYEATPIYHMGWLTIRPNLDRIGAKRILLTHMSDDMLANRHLVDDPRVRFAEDGLVLDL